MDDTKSSVARLRLDKWLWTARFFKTRALAAEAIDAGRIEVNGERVKRAKQVQVGDTLRVRKPPVEQVVVVRGVSERRGSAATAAELFEETPASTAAREAITEQLKAMGPPAFRDKGRPGKHERRDINRLRGRGE